MVLSSWDCVDFVDTVIYVPARLKWPTFSFQPVEADLCWNHDGEQTDPSSGVDFDRAQGPLGRPKMGASEFNIPRNFVFVLGQLWAKHH